MAKITFKIWLLIIFLIAFTLAINPSGFFKQGVLVKDIDQNSSASLSGLMKGEIITEVNGEKIKNIDDYNSAINKLTIADAQFIIKTSDKTFIYNGTTLDFSLTNKTVSFITGKAYESGLREGMNVSSINGEILNETNFQEIENNVESKIKIILKTEKNEYIFLISKNPGIVVSSIPKTNIRTGLDLQGGSRALVKPEVPLSVKELNDLVSVINNRLNVYGITDMKTRVVSDLSKNNYILIELAGATPSELRDLVSKQGKFEAKIGNETVFIGGKNDITFVCRGDASCSGIRECYATKEGYYCKFLFEIRLSEAAAKKQADATANLTENVSSSGESYLSEQLDLFLDDKIYDSLNIASDLKGQVATQISISGPGVGATQKEAYDNAQLNMKKLQTVLITGSLPYKLEIVKLDSISPALGKEFVNNIFFVIIAAWIGVFVVLFVRYRKFAPVLLVMFILTTEIYLTVGMAAFIKWNLDLASIAGIIAAIGTGVDDQVVIIDEGKIGKTYSWKERIKRSFGIILGAWATVFVAMLPLGWAGAGLFKGFAITTILGISVGVFVTRPAFSDLLEMITKE
ncbi:hypothetical protein COS75_01500 [Candidatus Pacearchaeota archaeon CG06_land_8_20_14_3_00_35_12]|nr:MAG: hypothetical protein COS75_01500 [Candidatus Pacearchaeota archaeon CG06_land_8_20_14_3_00_35_12]